MSTTTTTVTPVEIAQLIRAADRYAAHAQALRGCTRRALDADRPDDVAVLVDLLGVALARESQVWEEIHRTAARRTAARRTAARTEG